MSIPVQCSHCGHAGQVEEGRAGQRIHCPRCQQGISVPEAPKIALLKSIRAAAWTIAGILIALALLTLLGILIGFFRASQPAPVHF